jgi:hypothetical protein
VILCVREPDNIISLQSDPSFQSRIYPQSQGKKARRAIAELDFENEFTKREFEAWLQVRAPKGSSHGGGKPSTSSHPSGSSKGAPKEEGSAPSSPEKSSGSSLGSDLLNGISAMAPMIGGFMAGGGLGGLGGAGGSGSSEYGGGYASGGTESTGGTGGTGSTGGSGGGSGMGGLSFGSDKNNNTLNSQDQSNHSVSAGVQNKQKISF